MSPEFSVSLTEKGVFVRISDGAGKEEDFSVHFDGATGEYRTNDGKARGREATDIIASRMGRFLAEFAAESECGGCRNFFLRRLMVKQENGDYWCAVCDSCPFLVLFVD